MVNARNEVPHGNRGHRVVAISQDGAETWEPFYYSRPLIDPRCMAGLINHNGVLFFSNPDSETSRSHLTVKRSSDGASWAPIAMLDSGPSGYSRRRCPLCLAALASPRPLCLAALASHV